MPYLYLAAALVGLAAADNDRAAAEIGRSIRTVDKLLEYRPPAAPTDADRAKAGELRKAAVTAGQITKLYPWVLGRLKLEVTLVESALRDTKPDPARARELRERVEFLRRLMLEIDAPH